MKSLFDRKARESDFRQGDLVLRWDVRREDKGKHGKFDCLWQGPYVIYGYKGNNAFFLREIDVLDLPGGPVNGRMLKHYISND